MSELEKLQDLKAMGFIQDDEFERRKAELLGETATAAPTTAIVDTPSDTLSNIGSGPTAPSGASLPESSQEKEHDAGVRDGVVFYWSSKSFSRKIKADQSNMLRILEAKGVPFQSVDVAKNRATLEQMWALSGGLKALPQLHIDGRLIGLWEDVENLEEDGQLLPLLERRA